MEYLVSITALEVAAQVVQPEFAVEVSVGGPGAPGTPGQGVPVGGTTGQTLRKRSDTDYDTEWEDPAGGAVWGGITGTLSAQTDLQTALNGKVDKVAGKSLLADTEISRLASMTAIFTTALQAAYDGAVAWIATNGAALIAHLTNYSNPHNTTAAQVGAVATNAAITGATKTKVTYDAKGLVTAGTDATTADISASTDRRYVTDAELVVLGNTSGTNTGDQTITLTGDVTGSGTGSFAATIAPALKTAWDGAVSWIATNGTALIAHLSNTSNPHSTTAFQVGAEPTITGGTTAQYWRGDKTWRDFATDAIAAVVTRLLPSGGTTGQVLAKVDGTDYNVSWQTASSGIGGSGTTGTIPAFTAATTLGDSPITRSGTKVSVNGAAFLRQFNVYGPVLDARMFFHTDPGGTPGVEMATDSTGTRRALWRMAESGAAGTEWQGFVRPAAGGAVIMAFRLQENGQIYNSFLVPPLGINSGVLECDTSGNIKRGRVIVPSVDTSVSTFASSTAYNTICTVIVSRNSLTANGNAATLRGCFTITNNTGSSQTWGVRVTPSSAAAIFEDTIQALTTSASARFCTVEITIVRLSSTTYRMIGELRISQPGTPTTGLGEMGSGGAIAYTFGGNGTLGAGGTFEGGTQIFSFEMSNGISSASQSITQIISNTVTA